MDFLLTAFSYIFWVALALSILVFVHELGHYLAARVFGMRVDKFSIGF
ncbi:MAG: site-2 protease family protein, partial [Bacteroidota bacterium]